MPATYDSNILDTSMRRLPNCTLVRGVIVLELCQADRRHVDLVHRPLLHASELGLSDSGSDEGCHEMWVSCSTVALADERTCPLSLMAPSSLGGVLERGGFPAAHLVQDLRLVLIRVARGLDGPRGVGHQIMNYRNEALTLCGMLVGVQDDGSLSQGAQIAHDLGVCTLPQLDLARDRLFQLEVGHSAMG